MAAFVKTTSCTLPSGSPIKAVRIVFAIAVLSLMTLAGCSSRSAQPDQRMNAILQANQFSDSDYDYASVEEQLPRYL